MAWPGERLVIRLWETLAEKGIGALLKPWQIKREAMAHIEVRRAELLALTQTEFDAEEIRAGRKSLQDFSRDAMFGTNVPLLVAKDQPMELTTGLPVVSQIAARQMISDTIRREVNVAKAIIHAEAELKDDAQEPPKKKIDDDWLHRWRDYAGNVSAAEMQLLWGRLLAGELKAPDSYSLRTLDFMRNLSAHDARELEKLSRFVIENVIWRSDDDLLKSAGITFAFLSRMQSLGVIFGVEAIGLKQSWTSNVAAEFVTTLCSNGKVLIARHDDPKKQFELKIYTLTELGGQILKLGRFEPHLEYLGQVGRAIIQQGFSVSLGDYVRVSQTEIRLQNEVPVQAQQGAPVDGPASSLVQQPGG